MEEFPYDEALRLTKKVRDDLHRLLSTIHDRGLYDVSFKLGQSARSGIVFETVQKEFDRLEQLLIEKDVRTICMEDWSICDLVNYYDHLLDLIRSDAKLADSNDKHVKDLMEWRNTAGRLCQSIYHVDPDSDP